MSLSNKKKCHCRIKKNMSLSNKKICYCRIKKYVIVELKKYVIVSSSLRDFIVLVFNSEVFHIKFFFVKKKIK